MDELIDILDPDGKKTGLTCMKSEAHKKGFYHASVHVWIFDQKGNVLVQRRAKTKDTHPDHWDVSVAGHIGSGESALDSAVRETKEEVGLSINKTELLEIGYFKSRFTHAQDFKDFEYHYTYLCKHRIDLKDLIPQEEEVAELACLSLTEFKNEVIGDQDNYLFVPYGADYYQYIINEIKKRI